VTPPFFAAHPVNELLDRTDYWLGQQGRLTHPMILLPGCTHYQPIGWDAAFGLIADELRALAHPDEAVFYTSGRTSNEAAFVYQLMIRAFGTNNMPDCSNMCHESSGSALEGMIGIGKGSVSVTDLEDADLILIAGQNPGTNHPRMLSVLEKSKANGARVIAINPLPEAGLLRFKDPQKVHGVLGAGVAIADAFLQIRIGGDQALFQGLAKLLLEADDRHPDTVVDREFIDAHCAGFDEYADHIRNVDLDAVVEATGLSIGQIVETAQALMASKRTVICWAMGLTQHTHAVATIQDAVAVLLLRGMIGKPGAGVCPVRGHFNVQGDRTMGIWEKMPDTFLDALDAEFGITSPRTHGLDAIDSIRAMRDKKRRYLSRWAATSSRRLPTPRLPRRRCATAR
jgi:molybdopterin-dependent oxidoreductase alpha subunit